MCGADSCGTHERAERWLSTDACGVICAFVTWFLLLFACYVVNVHVIVPWLGLNDRVGAANALLFNSLLFLSLWSHLRAMLTDPGTVTKHARPIAPPVPTFNADGTVQETPDPRQCRRCMAYKPVKAHHCSICNRCVVKMDHHCPWVNNCVGIGNHKFFLLFCIYTCLACVHANVLIFSRLSKCTGVPHAQRKWNLPAHCNGSGVGALLAVCVIVEALLFGLFTCCMVCDQWSVVSSGTTQIDRYKAKKEEAAVRTSKTENMREVFGGKGVAWHWFLPVAQRWSSEEYKRSIYGFLPGEPLLSEHDERKVLLEEEARVADLV